MAKSALGLVGDIVGEMVRERTPGLEPKYFGEHVVDQAEIDRVRRFTTKRFVQYGKIDPNNVGADGLPSSDSYHQMSEYFACYDSSNNDILSAARLIWSPDCTIGDLRTPQDKLPKGYRETLEATPAGKLAELGSLAKASGASTVASMKVLREVFLFAADNGIDNLVCGLEPEVYPKFKQMFGASLHRMSDEEIEFPGIVGRQVPLHIEPMRAYAEQRSQMQRLSIGERATGLVVRTFFGKDVFDQPSYDRSNEARSKISR